MDLRNDRSIFGEVKIRTLCRDLCMEHGGIGTPLDRLHDNKDVPARNVVAELERLLKSEWPEVVKDRPKLEAFLAYALHQVATDKFREQVRKAAVLARKIGVRYDHAQTMFCKEFEDVGADDSFVEPDGGPLGWRNPENIEELVKPSWKK